MPSCEGCDRNIEFLYKEHQGRKYCSECYKKILRGQSVPNQQKEMELIEEKIKNLLVTSAHFFQHKTITQYFDLITSEVVIGTGPISEFGAAFSDFFGARSGSFEAKLQKAKDMAIKHLKYLAQEKEANAVIAVDIDYMEIGNNMLMVVVSGTPVVLSENFK